MNQFKLLHTRLLSMSEARTRQGGTFALMSKAMSFELSLVPICTFFTQPFEQGEMKHAMYDSLQKRIRSCPLNPFHLKDKKNNRRNGKALNRKSSSSYNPLDFQPVFQC